MRQLTDLTIKEAQKLLNNQEISATELTEAYIENAIAKRDINAYSVETFDIARKSAKESDIKIQNNNAGLLEGIPVGVKDLFCTKNVESTSCSHILDGFTPTYESTVSQKLFDSGAVMIGKTNMDEMAMGSANITSYKGKVKNPWIRNDNVEVVPGGSSGGSAAAVSSDICMAALGSDTGGSIRQPASFTGIVGMKPTYGRCSRYGMIAFASSLDQAGVMTKTVEDSAIMLQTICGHDEKDSTCSNKKLPIFTDAFTDKNIKGLKVGIPKEYIVDGMPHEIKDVWEQGARWLKEAGAEIIDISLSYTKYALPAYYIIAPAEASANLARYDGVRYGLRVCDEGDSLEEMYKKTRAAGFGDEVKRRIMIGTYVLSSGYYDAYYNKAQKIRRLIYNDFATSFDKVDVILTPTTPSTAFALNDKPDPITMYLNDVFTVPASLAGLPGISLPTAIADNGLPLGLQLIGKSFDEITVLKTAYAIEEAANFAQQIKEARSK
ncbi:MAG: Asp-tRNA(Asn)/Glu-tRNA(Gln) amidotransferase subunit GatA [Pseudomonadota bacterium]